MTPEEALRGINRLKASYHGMKPLDELTLTAYCQEIATLKWVDYEAGMTLLVRSSKFFPTIAEILEFADTACRKRLEKQDHVEREERLALQAGEEAIMNPKSGFHRVIQGPNHQRFVDILEGRIKLEDGDWVKRGKQAKEIR